MKYLDFEKLVNVVIYFFILTFSLPTGSLFNIPVQTYTIYLLFALFFFYIIKSKQNLFILIKSYLIEILVFIFGLIWCIYGYCSGYSLAFSEFKGLYISIVLLLIFVFFYKQNILNTKNIYKCLLIMVLAKVFLKFAFELLFIFKILDYNTIREIYFNIFDSSVATMTMKFSSLTLIRIQDASEAIVYSIFPFLFFEKNISRNKKITLFLFFCIYTIIVYSRLYIAHAICVIILTLLYYRNKITKKMIISFLIISILVILFFSEPVISIIKLRFFSTDSSGSDSIRDVQTQMLLNGFYKKPLFGHGMAAFVPESIRNEIITFSYEKEYLSYLYQFGIVGFFFIIVGIILSYLYRIIEVMKNKTNVISMVTYLGIMWFLVRPIFNPSFLGLQNCFCIIALFFVVCDKQNV